MNTFKHFPLSALALTAALLAGCASSTVSTTNQAAGAGGATTDVQFPDAGSAWLRNGAFVDVEQLRRIGRGMTKNQMRELISYPHFSEGLFGTKEWNYLFNFRTGKGDEYVTCQYKVVFEKGVSDAMYWKDPACADYLKLKVAGEAPRPVAAVQPKLQPRPEQFNLGADVLFAFDKSGTPDILPEGRRQLDDLAATLKSRYKRIDGIVVLGHTDRLGSESYNQGLSRARAATVRDYLVQAGLRAQNMQAQGRGESEPKVQCAKARRAELIDCLAPNRRVEIQVLGTS